MKRIIVHIILLACVYSLAIKSIRNEEMIDQLKKENEKCFSELREK